MTAATYGLIYRFSADNLANKISAAYYVYPHLQYASTFLRIYNSAAIIRRTPTHLHIRFRCRQHNNTRELNRTDVTNNNDFDERGGTKLSIVAEVHVMEGVAEDKLMSNMSDTTTPVLNQHTYVRSPNMSTSISQFWKLPLLRPECNEEQRSFTLNARNDIINTAQQAANITVHIASPCQHCGAQLFKGEFSKISIFRHRLYP